MTGPSNRDIRAPISKSFPNDSATLLIRAWLEHCQDCHNFCSSRELRNVFQDNEDILLIDVIHLRLVKGNTKQQYIALSYVWGKQDQFFTTASILDALMIHDSLRIAGSRIPQVIQDAIDLTYKLNQTFLWVDSL